MAQMLIVDDEERLLRVLRLGLPEHGFNVLTATNGQEALKILFDKQIDVVVTDVRMPVMDGVELIYEMERLDIKLPIVVTTAHADIDTAVKTFKHGACDYIRKPFSVEELVQSVKKAMQKVASLQASSSNDFSLQSQMDLKEKEAIQKLLMPLMVLKWKPHAYSEFPNVISGISLKNTGFNLSLQDLHSF